jgi:hypothetical protein
MSTDSLILRNAPAVAGSGLHPIRDEFWCVAGIVQCAVEHHLALHVRAGAS